MCIILTILQCTHPQPPRIDQPRKLFSRTWFRPQIISQKTLTLFLYSNVHSKSKTTADDIGQLVTYYSCYTLPNAPPSHAHAFEILLLRLTQMVGGIIVCFEACYQNTFSIFLHGLYRRFSHRALDPRNIPQLGLRSDRTIVCKNIEKVC